MWWHIVLAALLVGCAQAFGPAAIRWGGLPSSKFLFAPRSFLNTATGHPQQIIVGDGPDRMSHNLLFLFNANSDQTITVDTGVKDTPRWCIDASGSRSGDVVQLSHCTGGPNQRWNWLSSGHRGQVFLQLKDTNHCLFVNDNSDLNGARVELKECQHEATGSWAFESSIPTPALSWFQRLADVFPMRHALLFFIAVNFLGVLTVSACLWRRPDVVRSAALSQSGMDLSSVSLTVSSVACQNGRMTPAVMALKPTEQGNHNENDPEAPLASLSEGMERLQTSEVLHHSMAAPSESSEQSTAHAESHAWDLVTAAQEALKGNHFWAALGFAVAAATVFDDIEVARAVVPPEVSEVFSQGVDAVTPTLAASASTAFPDVDVGGILGKAGKKALGGGKAGASAAIVQVFSLMWLRTAMNYQYRYGGDLRTALKTLFEEGGIPRLYQGLPFAVVQGPLARFGDTASNIGVLALLDSIPETAGLPLPIKTAAGSVTAGLWRIFCMPIDTSKTAMQVEGETGLERLKQKVLDQGPGPLYQGSIATAAATFVGNYPWFLTYNYFDGSLPAVPQDHVLESLIRAAFLGLSASCVSDSISNSLRVIKTTQQTALLRAPETSAGSREEVASAEEQDEQRMMPDTEGSLGSAADGKSRTPGAASASASRSMSIKEAFELVLETDGIQGLLGRGLQTRLLTNAIQGIVFSVAWKYFQSTGGPS